MYKLAEAIFAYIDRWAAASVAGFTEAEAIHAGALQARRHALLEPLATQRRRSAAELERRTRGGRVSHRHRATSRRSRSASSDPGAAGARAALGLDRRGARRVGLVLIADPEGPGRRAQMRAVLRDRRAVLGPTVAGSARWASVRRVLLAWPVHAAGGLGEQTLARTDDHLVTLLLAASPRLTDELSRVASGRWRA